MISSPSHLIEPEVIGCAPTIARIELTAESSVPGIDGGEYRRLAQQAKEAEERATTCMDRENRDRAARNRYLAEGHVAELG